MFFYEREIRGQTYRMAAESIRVQGKPHPVSRQVCLGPVGSDKPVVVGRAEVVETRRLGDVGALLWVAEQLDLVGVFDDVVGRRGDGPGLGELVLATAVQRVCVPGPKRDLPTFLGGCVPRVSLRPVTDFSGAAFHRLTRGITEEQYDQIQREIAVRACRLFELKTDVLAFDTSNFDTFIATTTKGKLARRGHAKSKRADLRVVGLAMMTSATGGVPLFHRTYAGNTGDSKVLAGALASLGELHARLSERADKTLVRDGGFSGEQLELDLVGKGYHSVVGLGLGHTLAKSALTAAVGHMKRLKGKLADIRAFRQLVEVGSEKRTLVVVSSPELLAGQMRGLRRAQRKAVKELERLEARVARERAGNARGRRLTRSGLEARTSKLLAGEHLSSFIKVDISGTEEGPTLRHEVDKVARRHLVRERLGKRVLMTDQHAWTTSRIVRAFRSQANVERSFRRMKRGAVCPWGPSFQWTDDSLRAHTFASVLGLQLASLVRLLLQRDGLKLSARGAMRMLGQIRVEILRERTHKRGRPRDLAVPRRAPAEARPAIDRFELARWMPNISTTA